MRLDHRVKRLEQRAGLGKQQLVTTALPGENEEQAAERRRREMGITKDDCDVMVWFINVVKPKHREECHGT